MGQVYSRFEKLIEGEALGGGTGCGCGGGGLIKYYAEYEWVNVFTWELYGHVIQLPI